jgi:hypothetical protein
MVITRAKEIRKITGKVILNNIDVIADHFRERAQIIDKSLIILN